MKANNLTEKMLDKALAHALENSTTFATWMLERTCFKGQNASCTFVRANHTWSSVSLAHVNPHTGAMENVIRQCETDVLAVFETSDGRRLGLHIENKLAGGFFTSLQPELYKARCEQWRGRPLLGNYSEATTVLVAPQAFYDRFEEEVRLFDSLISHEAIAEELDALGLSFTSPT